MSTQSSYSRLISQTVVEANRPLTLAEIRQEVERVRSIDTANPSATVRNAIRSDGSIASLGGRPASYVWWPRHLVDNSFRLPLSSSDIERGTLALNKEAWAALWPDFLSRSDHREGDVTLDLAGGVMLSARIQHLVPRQAVWGLPATPALADWYRQQGAMPEDELVIRVLDVDSRRYAVALCRQSERDEEAILTRNRALADIAEGIVRAGRPDIAYFDLIPRLIARDGYRDSLPPDPWVTVLRADLRFVVSKHSAWLSQRLVDSCEREIEIPPGPWKDDLPQGDRRKLYAELGPGEEMDGERRAWGDHLFDRGMDHKWADWALEAEAYYKEALRIDAGHADAWVHLGNLRFEEEHFAEALALYERGQAAAEARTIGDPAAYERPFWGDVVSRPFMRAVYGRALCLWQLGRIEEARKILEWMMVLNPGDNQGARFLLAELDDPAARWLH
ncbi:MAG TPA: hypothetical protein VM537_04125 [Anaerolineae bacterium]|nr:hypothetical protein [Anaerolineae bacterium]